LAISEIFQEKTTQKYILTAKFSIEFDKNINKTFSVYKPSKVPNLTKKNDHLIQKKSHFHEKTKKKRKKKNEKNTKKKRT
jgi:hypothetical protein